MTSLVNLGTIRRCCGKLLRSRGDVLGEEYWRMSAADDARRGEQQTSTFHQHAQAAANDTGGGRFGAIGAPILTGTTPIPQYPQAGPPFQVDPVGDEPPLSGYENPALNVPEPSPPRCAQGTGPASADTQQHADVGPSQNDQDNG